MQYDKKSWVPAPNLIREKSWDPSFHEKSWTFTIFLNHEKSGDAPILLKIASILNMFRIRPIKGGNQKKFRDI